MFIDQFLISSPLLECNINQLTEKQQKQTNALVCLPVGNKSDRQADFLLVTQKIVNCKKKELSFLKKHLVEAIVKKRAANSYMNNMKIRRTSYKKFGYIICTQ